MNELKRKLTEDSFRWWKQLEKKIRDKPEPLQVLNRRTMNTAISVLQALLGIPYTALSASLYFYCADAGISEFTRQFEAQIELAGANPERFAGQLHSFMTKIGKQIKKEGLMGDFMEYLHICFRLKDEMVNDPNINKDVINAYLNLIMQVTEYIRPNQFDLNQLVCGMATDGEILTMKDPFPMLDLGGYLVRESIDALLKKGIVLQEHEIDQLVCKCYQKYHYNIKDPKEIEEIANSNRAHNSMLTATMPLINEYTSDMLPIRPFSTWADRMIQITRHDIQWNILDLLRQRDRTLPSNGLEIRFTSGHFYQKLFLKEICYRWHIYALYRYETEEGDITGFIDTKTTTFYSAILSETDGELYAAHRDLTLFCYAAFVLDHPEIQITKLGEHFREAEIPITGESILHGGALRNQYHPEKNEEQRTGLRSGERYTRENRSIQGYIRTLPLGQSASEHAISTAVSLGYRLRKNETYVQPFVKQVVKLKDKK